MFDFEQRSEKRHKLPKPQVGEECCLKHVAEMRPNAYLLSIESMNPNFRYLIYDESKPHLPLRQLKARLSDKTF